MVVPEWFMATGPPFSMDVDGLWTAWLETQEPVSTSALDSAPPVG